MEKFSDRILQFQKKINGTRNKFDSFYQRINNKNEGFMAGNKFKIPYLNKINFNEVFIDYTYPNLKEEFKLNKKNELSYIDLEDYIENIQSIYEKIQHNNLLIEIDKSMIKDDFEKKLAHSITIEAYIKQVSVYIMPFNDLYKIDSSITKWEDKDIYKEIIENSELMVINNINHNKHNKNNVKNISNLINTIEERTNDNLTTIVISRIPINNDILDTDYYFKQKLVLS